MKKETRGGKREGSGQPKKEASEKAKALNVKIYDEHFLKLKKIHPNKSKAVRMAIDSYKITSPS